MVARDENGSAIIELSIAGVLLVIIALLCVDMGMVAWGISRNDQACHDAARAAADGTDSNDALTRAKAALAAHAGDGFWFTTPQLDTSKFVYQDFGGQPPPGDGPYVTVGTTASVRVPVPVTFEGATFAPGGILQTSKQFTFPIIRTTPASPGAPPNAGP